MMNRRVGVPTAVKPLEGRVALTPAAAGELVRCGVGMGIQPGAGIAGGYPDAACHALGANVTVFDKNPRQLDRLYRVAPDVTGLPPTGSARDDAGAAADLPIAAVLLAGAVNVDAGPTGAPGLSGLTVSGGRPVQ
jgi:alanine dehydrogenase